jgi:hypothetical protein
VPIVPDVPEEPEEPEEPEVPPSGEGNCSYTCEDVKALEELVSNLTAKT